MDKPVREWLFRSVSPRTSSCGLHLILATTISFLASGIGLPASADDSSPSLHEAIDQLVAAGWQAAGISPAQPADDAEFLRRTYLDLTGCIPTSMEARAFLEDPAPDKRIQLIDRLLASPECARHMSRVFDVMLMERRADKHVPTPEWREFLRKSFAENKPWDQLAREILASDGAEAATRPAAKFLLDREGEPTLLTKDVTRLFLGMNYQCAQCHDHPLVDDYVQQHYYGIFAFLSRTYLFTDKKNKNQVSLAEKAEGEVKFTSVFDKTKTEQTTGPRILEAPPVEEPKFEKGQEYSVAPADGVRPIPKFSRRAQLAVLLPVPTNTAFNRNIANRLWALMMGRGLVHPLDLDHADNPASHPELLELLAQRTVEMRYDIRGMLREIALSQTYQRSSRQADGLSEAPKPESFAVALLKPLSPEQLAWCTMQATGITEGARAALGDKCNEQTLHDRLAGNVAPFVNTFGGPVGEPDGRFQPSLDQALFLSNGNHVRGWLAPSGGNLADRLTKLAQSEQVAEELYLSVLTRRPTAEEQLEVVEYLKPRTADRANAVQELIWAMLTSSEYRLNH